MNILVAIATSFLSIFINIANRKIKISYKLIKGLSSVIKKMLLVMLSINIKSFVHNMKEEIC